MLSMILFISGGEIFFVLLAILVFFGADKIPEFVRVMGKGVREFKKATDDIKREFNESSSGLLSDIRSVGDDLTRTLNREIAEPVKETANEAKKTFEEYENEYNSDYYYEHPDDMGNHVNEFQKEVQESIKDTADEITKSVEA